jgi:hemerythrin superfamily protein
MPTNTRKRPSSTRSATARKSRSSRARNGASRGRDVIALIKSDHASVNQLFRRFNGLSDRATKSRRNVADRLINDLSVHAVVEEQVLYPTARAWLPDGEELVREALDEHQGMKEDLAALEKCRPDSEEFDARMARIEHEVRHHVKEEESAGGILGQLRKHVSRNQLLEMAKLTRQAKQAAPTRPHPKAPNTPPANAIVGAVAAMIDKVRDGFTGRAPRS